MDKKLERILPRVQKPARYVGGEYNAVIKDKAQVDTRIAFCFPDTYEIGMSNLGMRILYGVMNQMEGVWCERVFAGKYVELTHTDGYTTLYAHCSRINASAGQTVKMGDPIAEAGDTGDATGYHLHFELHHNNIYLNPVYYVSQ